MTMNIEAEAVTVRYGRIMVLDITGLVVGGPGLVAVTGPNGAGKSTLLRLCAGLERPKSGTVTVGGVSAHRRRARLTCGYSPDHPVLFDDLTIADNMAYAHESGGAGQPTELARDLSTAFELERFHDRFPSQLSRGQRQAASLAVATARPVEIHLFDEPTLALDQENRSRLGSVLAAHAEDHLFVIAGHEASLVDRAARTITLSDGRLVS